MFPKGKLRERINRLEEPANNLWWSWHSQARDLFPALDYPLWRSGRHNPVKQSREISTDRLAATPTDSTFLNLYDFVMASFDAEISDKDSWFATNYPICVRRMLKKYIEQMYIPTAPSLRTLER